MRLALSNLAYPAVTAEGLLPRLAAMGLTGIEVAPTRLAPWDALSDGALRGHRGMLAGMGLCVSSLQAILFGAEGVALLGEAASFERLVSHLARVAEVGAVLGASVAVLGAPRQRARGALAAEEAFRLGAERLRRAAETMQAGGGPVLGLEPVPAAYGGDFLETWQEALAMVRAVDHPWLRLHLDTACVHLGGGDIAEAVAAGIDELAHFHLAEPKLVPFDAPRADHAGAAAALTRVGYGGWLSIEMMERAEDPEGAAVEAVTFALAIYGTAA